ncbi:hypothetical protein PAEPH01_2439 [Pancytospora epiphaga]|nr:hypothetical protein PAEPH01_2439 [Pancytospora epiphaga]
MVDLRRVDQSANKRYSFPRSLLEQYFKLGRLPSYPRGHDTVNLLVEKQSSLTDSFDSSRKIRKKYSFEFIPDGTTVTMHAEIERLESLDQDISEWIDSFRMTAETCGWNEIASKQILRNVMAPQILKEIGNAENTEDMLIRLMKLKFPREKKGFLQNRLKKIKQEDFMRIGDYQRAVEEMTRITSIASEWGKGETERRLEEQFMAGLGDATSRQVDLLGLTTMPQILERLMRTEEKLIEQIDERGNERGFEGERRAERTITAKSTSGNKWCSYHKSHTHDNSECFTRKIREANQKNTGVTSQPAPTTQGSKDTRPDPKKGNAQNTNNLFETHGEKPFQFMGQMSNLRINWIFDTGASSCFLSQDIAKRANLQIEPIEKGNMVTVGNGALVEILGKANITVEFEQLPGIH